MALAKNKQEKDLEIFNQVEALSDLEICSYLAEIEGLSTYKQFDSIRVQVTDGDDYYFNPIENSEQCLNLMVKHEVERKWEPYDFIGWSYHVLEGLNPIHVTERQDFEGSGKPDLSTNKAVCLAIILNKSERFKLKS